MNRRIKLINTLLFLLITVVVVSEGYKRNFLLISPSAASTQEKEATKEGREEGRHASKEHVAASEVKQKQKKLRLRAKASNFLQPPFALYLPAALAVVCPDDNKRHDFFTFRLFQRQNGIGCPLLN